ncbi:hypothetical protein EST38_g11031 [Candolleomyces aberdarensis]|uniref:Uncharacterized protein n=1 Tax=Candolleomyces aberdarensis TaxID=2316362 RepID=A0A4Q2D7G9_9AGAR|nr:hypothetical protein EST38_g11031 [Candolleomyces aberdarensis]
MFQPGNALHTQRASNFPIPASPAVSSLVPLGQGRGSFPASPLGYEHPRPSSTPIQAHSRSQSGLRSSPAPHLLGSDGWDTTDHRYPASHRSDNGVAGLTPGSNPLPDSSFSSSESFFFSDDPITTSTLPPVPNAAREPPSVISEDLYNRVASEYALSAASQSRLHNFAKLMSKANTPKGHAIPSFIQLAATLCTHDLLVPQVTQLPAVEEMNRLYQKMDNLLSLQSTNASLSASQKENIRALVGSRMFDKTFYNFSTLNEVVMEVLQKKSDHYGLQDAFESAAATKNLRSKLGTITSSVINNFREEICHSIGDKALPLARFAYQCAKKYVAGGYTKLEKGHILKLALLRRFLMDHSEVGIQEGGARGKKRKIVVNTEDSQLSTATESDTMVPGMQDQQGAPAGKIVSFANELLDDLPLPPSMTFVNLWEWFLSRNKIMIGAFGSAGWKSYMDWVVNEDLRLFPLPDGEVVPGVSHPGIAPEILHAAYSGIAPEILHATYSVRG